MGTTIVHGATRADIIRELTAGWETAGAGTRTLRHCTRGNVLYSVRESYGRGDGKPDSIWIGVDLLIRSREGWGYKSQDESMGPYHYSCPLAYLDAAGPPESQWAIEWRDKVRAWHARRPARLRAGDRVDLVEGCTLHGKPVMGAVLIQRVRGKWHANAPPGVRIRFSASAVARVAPRAS